MKRSEVIAPTSTQNGILSCKRCEHTRILISYSLCFYGFEVKSGSAYYLFYLASKWKQDGCYSNRKELNA